MPIFENPKNFRHTQPGKIGILLINLGTPDGSDTASVRRYLKIFLSDPRVVEIPRIIWWCILNGVILPLRAPKSAAKYAQIWTPAGSPLLVNSQKQAQLLRGYLGEQLRALNLPSDLVKIELAMRYGSPSIEKGMQTLREAGCDKILSLPLYPQYAASTTASAHDAVFDICRQLRWQPALRTVTTYHDFSPYIQALATRIQNYWQQQGKGDILVISFHGLPRFSLEKGDPYYCFCQKTARLLAKALNLQENEYRVSFQSRFGRTEWLKPYTTEVLSELGQQGVKRVDITCPGFTSDCLETLEEIAIEGKHDFLKAGGKEYHYIEALNDFGPWIDALAQLCLKELGGWLAPLPTPDELNNTLLHAQKKGASF